MSGRRKTSRNDVITTGLPVASSIRQDGGAHIASGDAGHAWLALAAAMGRAAARADRATTAPQTDQGAASNPPSRNRRSRQP